MSQSVVICECFARDGLQHEADFIATDDKVAMIDRFTQVGFPRIEASSFAHPKYVPQFADVDDVLARIKRRAGVRYKATCVNPQSVQRAIATQEAGHGPEEISVLLSASESHTKRNLNRTRAEQWANIEAMVALGKDRFTIVGTVSVAFGCPFEGRIDPGIVIDDAKRLADLGVRYIAIADTTGLGTPRTVGAMFRRAIAEIPGITPIVHFHDTRSSAIANCVAALDAGATHFDSAIGGVGGHPAKIQYGEGFTGNVCTEDLVGLFEAMGVDTGLDLDALMQAAEACEALLGRPLRSMVAKSGLSPFVRKGA